MKPRNIRKMQRWAKILFLVQLFLFVYSYYTICFTDFNTILSVFLVVWNTLFTWRAFHLIFENDKARIVVETCRQIDILIEREVSADRLVKKLVEILRRGSENG